MVVILEVNLKDKNMHRTVRRSDHFQEIKAHYCIIQQNTLINLVNLINNSTYSKFAGSKLGFSGNANNYLPTHNIRRDNSYRSILLVVTLSVASVCSVA